MAVKLRLTRTGKRNAPCYRVVAADSRSPRDGKFIEVLGHYNPRQKEEQVDLDRVDYWLSNGAQPSETVTAIVERVRSGRQLEKAAPKNIAPAAPKKVEAETAAEPAAETAAEDTAE